jgi:hypothetical protein
MKEEEELRKRAEEQMRRIREQENKKVCLAGYRPAARPPGAAPVGSISRPSFTNTKKATAIVLAFSLSKQLSHGSLERVNQPCFVSHFGADAMAQVTEYSASNIAG